MKLGDREYVFVLAMLGLVLLVIGKVIFRVFGPGLSRLVQLLGFGAIVTSVLFASALALPYFGSFR
ncbi:hypothetical protein HNO88_004106 [Novosphingobium chloroacetimidivorans]|uniref:Uncharacterized protein n=1 Tax=Novosphingobium chloroacetimidivorans TaxID=1428314 RepID=A0A7W7KE59_9SPHN|nr:hypothetical protein [Novosphingobium chloroacetimidivorans]MBB4860761.1 hypothetical protein [Novosphingobium chloroacetimidivorans]